MIVLQTVAIGGVPDNVTTTRRCGIGKQMIIQILYGTTVAALRQYSKIILGIQSDLRYKHQKNKTTNPVHIFFIFIMFLCYKQYFWFTVDVNKNHFAKILLFFEYAKSFSTLCPEYSQFHTIPPPHQRGVFLYRSN